MATGGNITRLVTQNRQLVHRMTNQDVPAQRVHSPQKKVADDHPHQQSHSQLTLSLPIQHKEKV